MKLLPIIVGLCLLFMAREKENTGAKALRPDLADAPCLWSDKTDSVGKPVFGICIPDAFSPNGDGTNDYFQAAFIYSPPSTYSMTITDGWNNLLFTTKDPLTPWNGADKSGKIMKGSFQYKIACTDTTGQTYMTEGRAMCMD